MAHPLRVLLAGEEAAAAQTLRLLHETGQHDHVFAPTAPLAERIHAIDPELRSVHLNRGDGDGSWGEIRRGAWGDAQDAI